MCVLSRICLINVSTFYFIFYFFWAKPKCPTPDFLAQFTAQDCLAYIKPKPQQPTSPLASPIPPSNCISPFPHLPRPPSHASHLFPLPAASPSPLVCPIPSPYTPFYITDMPTPMIFGFPSYHTSHLRPRPHAPNTSPLHLHGQIGLPPCILCHEKSHQIAYLKTTFPTTMHVEKHGGVTFFLGRNKQQFGL